MMIMMTLKKYARLLIQWEGTQQKLEQKGKATSSNSSVGTECSIRSEAMMTQLNSTLERHMAETVRFTEYTLLMQDVRHLDHKDQEAARIMKASIREKYNLKCF
ncbi:unnamed protein product [Lactuca saligna]|uniref:Uncharacterized protein n=1 Tax=Lactuca saligna TaxID=75948 RepID=A0AA35YJK1_LACSI|nr:unnamed protein product [Lactuca saligna]